MQFIPDGPDVPEALLQAHEDGRLVFFSGAGISYRVGLKGFRWLVDETYRLSGTTRTEIETKAYEKAQFDTTLNLLEARLPGKRQGLRMRKAVAKALQSDLERPDATATHSALLHLGRSRDGALRLVTTNFDRAFELAAKSERRPLKAYAAPMLPIPRSSQWNGLVYLHGVLPETDDDLDALHRLVITSGDFGLAYLTERWGARFVSELFRNYLVCFVGYGVNDPVLRYMMDALAADGLRGEESQRAYAFGPCEDGFEDETIGDWDAKGVRAVLYNPVDEHSHLHKTLGVWASDYRNGARGKEQVVVNHALSNPSESTNQDDFVGRMLWALADSSGLPAKRFAEFNPVPPLSWLAAFEAYRFRHEDLSRFGVSPDSRIDDNLQFSLIHRPAPYSKAPWMSLVDGGHNQSRWDDGMAQLAYWLVRHSNDPTLILWVAKNGGNIHERFRGLIESHLDRVANKQNDNVAKALDQMRAHAPNAIPNPQMYALWRLMLAGRVKSPDRELSFYPWINRFKREGMAASLRLEFRDLLAPRLALREAFRWGEYVDATAEPEGEGEVVECELVLAADHVRVSLSEVAEERWAAVLPQMLDDIQQLLNDALGLLQEIGKADDRGDGSHWDLPSISPHWQNRGYRDWVALIELLRDAWLATRIADSARAGRIARDWFNLPFPTFKRLALFAASQDEGIASEDWLDWLLVDDCWWLWSVETERETMRLLVSRGARLSSDDRFRLETRIIAGPPRHMYRDDLEPKRWERIRKDSIWVLLTKLSDREEALSPNARSILHEPPPGRADWTIERDNQRNEFTHWMSGTGDPDYEETRTVDVAPRTRRELIKWLKQPSAGEPSSRDDQWRETCRTRFFHSLLALCDLSREGVWPVPRWRTALQVWSDKAMVNRSWRIAAPLVDQMPPDVLQKLLHNVAWWLESASKSIDRHESVHLNLCGRVLEQPHQDTKSNEEAVGHAINHSVGLVTMAILNVWFKKVPNDADGIPKDIRPSFTRLCGAETQAYRHGRVILASRLIALFRIDPDWTETYLIPWFDWANHPDEAPAVWQGFLWSPRLHRPLLITFKEQLLESTRNYSKLGRHADQLARFLTFAALDAVEGFSVQEFRAALEALPQEGRQQAADALCQALESSEEQREDYWRSRVQPFLQQVWPKLSETASSGFVTSMANLSIAARKEFPGALDEVFDWLQPIEHPYGIVRRLHESALCARCSEEALKLLDRIIDEKSWPPNELRLCLNAIAENAPDLVGDPRYQDLDGYARKRGR